MLVLIYHAVFFFYFIIILFVLLFSFVKVNAVYVFATADINGGEVGPLEGARVSPPGRTSHPEFHYARWQSVSVVDSMLADLCLCMCAASVGRGEYGLRAPM